MFAHRADAGRQLTAELAERGVAADEVVVFETPRRFVAVGSHYRDFSQVSDEAAMGYLEP